MDALRCERWMRYEDDEIPMMTMPGWWLLWWWWMPGLPSWLLLMMVITALPRRRWWHDDDDDATMPWRWLHPWWHHADNAMMLIAVMMPPVIAAAGDLLLLMVIRLPAIPSIMMMLPRKMMLPLASMTDMRGRWTRHRLVTKSTEFKSDLKSKSKFCLSQSFPPDLET